MVLDETLTLKKTDEDLVDIKKWEFGLRDLDFTHSLKQNHTGLVYYLLGL